VPIECLYEDDELFVLNKPSGMLVHRGWGLGETVLVDFARSHTAGGAAHPVQRLDRGASGPVLFARNAEVAHELCLSAQAGDCRKEYLALVRGVAPEKLDIDHPISRREEGPRVAARTLARRIATVPTEPRHVSLVSATPLTGRLHQVRRHLKHANYPLIGDGRYGRSELNRAFRDGYALARLALHAYAWFVRRPGSDEIIRGTVPLPSDLSEPLCRMGFELEANGLPAGLLRAC
jgi:tRNA pseudouridine65 synthase